MSYIVFYANDSRYKGLPLYVTGWSNFGITTSNDIKKSKSYTREEVGYVLMNCGELDGYDVPQCMEDPRISAQHSAAQKDPDRWMLHPDRLTPLPESTQDLLSQDLAEGIFQKIQDDLQKEVNNLQTSQEISISLVPETSVRVELQPDGSARLYLTALGPPRHKEDASAATPQARLRPSYTKDLWGLSEKEMRYWWNQKEP